MRPIGLLSIGLVLSTMLGVAVVAHEMISSLTWPAAFVLGAVVSPTDPLAATAIAQRLGIPRRIVAIIEGESLVNDGPPSSPTSSRCGRRQRHDPACRTRALSFVGRRGRAGSRSGSPSGG